MKKKMFALFGIMLPLAILIALVCAYKSYAKSNAQIVVTPHVKIKHLIESDDVAAYKLDLVWLEDGRECAVAYIQYGGPAITMNCTPPTNMDVR